MAAGKAASTAGGSSPTSACGEIPIGLVEMPDQRAVRVNAGRMFDKRFDALLATGNSHPTATSLDSGAINLYDKKCPA